MTAPILKDEPLCYNSRDYLRTNGWGDDDYEMEHAYESRGPNKDCACDVCFYGRRAHWLDGRKSVADWLRSLEPAIDEHAAHLLYRDGDEIGDVLAGEIERATS